MGRRIVLSAREIEAILAVAGNALAYETFAGDEDLGEEGVERMVAAYESGIDKLSDMLAARERRRRTSRSGTSKR